MKSLQSTQPAEYQTVSLANRIKKLRADFTAHVWPTVDGREVLQQVVTDSGALVGTLLGM